MKRIKRINEYPKGTPIKLIMAYRKANQNERELSRRLNINVFYISNGLKGLRPSNNEIALKLFFPKRVRNTVDYSKIKLKRISDMPSKELLWRLEHREAMK